MVKKLRPFKKATVTKHKRRLHRIRKASKQPFFAVPMLVFLILSAITVGLLLAFNRGDTKLKPPETNIVVVTYDKQERTVPSRAPTVGVLLDRLGITLHEGDVVEPSKDTKITSDNFRVNVYRGKPVTIVEGGRKVFSFSAAATPRSVVKQAGITVYPEDELRMLPTENFLAEASIGSRIVIERATPVNVNLYGTQVAMRTRAKTVGDLLKERNVKLGKDDAVQPSQDATITANMQVFLLRKGTQIAVIEEEIPAPVQRIEDNSLSTGTRAVRQQGTPGKRLVTYQINLENGQEVSRTQIQSIEAVPPVTHIEAVGTRSIGGLTKSKGVFFFTDSRGVTHRETYYDLPMSGVMRFCGGTYSVRSDGAKVDKDGYILVAANLKLYPRCSIVETSLGAGKVYDTGAFVDNHPHGFDLATDWSNNDGR